MFEKKKISREYTIKESIALLKGYGDLTTPQAEEILLSDFRLLRYYHYDGNNDSLLGTWSEIAYSDFESHTHPLSMVNIDDKLFKYDSEESSYVCMSPHIENVFELFMNRNWLNYCLKIETREEPTHRELFEHVKQFINNLINILHMTKDKYVYLLDTYANEKNNLLNKLQRTRNLGVADTRNVTGESKQFINTTPQEPALDTEDYFDYVNQASKNNDTTSDVFSSSQNEYISEDRDYLIDKIDSIDKKMDLLLKRWCKELDVLCWEE